MDSASFISQLNINLPTSSATLSLGAQRWQHIKRTIVTTLPNLNSAVTVTPEELNHLNGLTSDFQAQINTLKNDALALSASIQAQIEAMQADIIANKVSASGTAMDSIRWNGARQFWQSDTPATAVDGDIWFKLGE